MDDDALKGLLNANSLPMRDSAFELAVMARIERRQFRLAVAKYLALTLGMVLLLALLAPRLESFWQKSFAPLAGNLVIVIVLLLTADVVRRLIRPLRD